jgi:hypothetical protein
MAPLSGVWRVFRGQNLGINFRQISTCDQAIGALWAKRRSRMGCPGGKAALLDAGTKTRPRQA